MQTFTAAQLLDVWEAGRGRPALACGVLLLSLAFPELEAESLPFGRFNAHLLTIREQLFGTQLESVVACPQCGEQLEFALDAEMLGATATLALAETIAVNAELMVRWPTVGDVLAARGDGDVLFGRIITQGDPTTVSPETQEAAAELLQDLDPLVNIEFALACQECGHTWRTPFDIASFVQLELDHWAQRLLHSVHRLATAYGWSERDILAMSAWRRAYYMELVNA